MLALQALPNLKDSYPAVKDHQASKRKALEVRLLGGPARAVP